MPYKLSANENPFGVSEKVIKALHEFKGIHIYPDPYATDLKKALAQTFKLNAQQILCGCGSEDLLFSLIRNFSGPGDEVLIPRHGFLIYDSAVDVCGATPVYVDYGKSMQLEATHFLSKITPATKIMCFDQPANPMGTFMSRGDVKTLLDSVPPHIMVIIDSAYSEYMFGYDAYSDGMEFVNQYPNVVVTRSFSKAYGLASMRLGWLYASADLMMRLKTYRVLYKTTGVAQKCAESALQDPDFVRKTVLYSQEKRKEITLLLEQKKLLAWPTYANFVLCRFENKEKADDFVLWLLQHDIDVFPLKTYKMETFVRISIGSPPAHEALMTALWRYEAQG